MYFYEYAIRKQLGVHNSQSLIDAFKKVVQTICKTGKKRQVTS